MGKKSEEVAIVKEVDSLPEVAIESVVIFNKSDGYFYIGMENNTKKGEEDGYNLEEAGI